MNLYPKISWKKLQELHKLAQWGWWKANFHTQTYLFSDDITELLNLDSDTIGFEDFAQLIPEHFRDRIYSKSPISHTQDIYEQIYPIQTIYGEIWVHSRLGQKEQDENGHLIGWGYLQAINHTQQFSQEKQQQQLNELLARQNSISRSLLSFLKTEDPSREINNILKDILLQFNGSRAYIFEYDFEQQLQTCTYEVLAQGVSAEKDNLQRFPIDSTPWWTLQIQTYTPIVLFNLDELPPEAAIEKEVLGRQGIKSILVVPMIAKDRVGGYLGVDITDEHHTWTNEDYQWLSAMSNITSICIELQKSEQIARKEREYFKNLYQHMPLGYVRLKLLYDQERQPYDYIFLDINPAFEQITGFPLADFINKTAREMNIPLDMLQKQLQDMWTVQSEQTTSQATYKLPTQQKYLRMITYSLDPNEITVIFSDMTDIVKAHEALDRSEKTLRNIYKNIPVGIEIYDKEGYLRDMNDKDVEIFGLQDKSWGLGVNIFDNPNIPNEIKQKIKNRENVDFELKYDFSDIQGYYRTQEKGVKDLIVKLTALYDSNNELENYLLLLIDNTETTTAYSKIKEFESFFSVISEFAKVGYFKWNIGTKTGFALEQWYKNWGETENTSLEEIINHHPHIHPDDRYKIDEYYGNLSKGILDNFKEEVRIDNGRGGWNWIRCYVAVKEYDPKTRNIEIIGVNIDITELKEVEAQLIEAKEKAETLDKLKSAFLANMSHEIRTPLNAIVGFSNLLSETENQEEKKQYITIIEKNSDLLLQLISDVLDLSKIEAGTLDIIYSDVDVNGLCREIVRSLEMKPTKGVTLEFENHLPECKMRGDRNRLLQIITNFINNAIKFTSSGFIRLGYNLQGNTIEFYVSDTGIGISPKHAEQIFDRFVKLNSFIHGTGLGLSICKSMVEQMGGKIGVESEEGKGSRFWFELPFTPVSGKEKTSPVPAHLSQGTLKNTNKPVILVAEDTESNFILTSTILRQDYTILWAHNGKEAIELFRANHPALILMDIRMPEMDGLEATRNIRKADPDIPIVALTAFAFDSDKHKALEAGCNDYLSKPIQAATLKEKIRELLAQSPGL